MHGQDSAFLTGVRWAEALPPPPLRSQPPLPTQKLLILQAVGRQRGVSWQSYRRVKACWDLNMVNFLE